MIVHDDHVFTKKLNLRSSAFICGSFFSGATDYQ